MGGHLRSIKHGWFALRLSVAAEKPGEVKAGECPAFSKRRSNSLTERTGSLVEPFVLRHPVDGDREKLGALDGGTLRRLFDRHEDLERENMLLAVDCQEEKCQYRQRIPEHFRRWLLPAP